MIDVEVVIAILCFLGFAVLLVSLLIYHETKLGEDDAD